jgi:hypothetical protein
MAREITEVWIYVSPLAPDNVCVKAAPFEGLPESRQQHVTRVPLLTPHDAAVLAAAEVQADAHGDWVACTCVEFHCAHYVAYSGKCAVTEYTVGALREVRARRAANAGGENAK